jgi:hypothetical protein
MRRHFQFNLPAALRPEDFDGLTHGQVPVAGRGRSSALHRTEARSTAGPDVIQVTDSGEILRYRHSRVTAGGLRPCQMMG